jgi:hypothetical protein
MSHVNNIIGVLRIIRLFVLSATVMIFGCNGGGGGGGSVNNSGIVTGTIYKGVNTPVPDAQVTLCFAETDTTITTQSDSNGQYAFTGLPYEGDCYVLAYEPLTRAGGVSASYVVMNNNTQYVNVIVNSACKVNPALMNADFASGTFDAWELIGPGSIVDRNEVLADVSSAPDMTKPLSTIPPAYSALVTTAGDYVSVGFLSQSFIVGQNDDTLIGKIRFLSNEWPTYYGSQYNDSYIVYLITSSGIKIITHGNLNTSSWSTGVCGFEGGTKPAELYIDVSMYRGQVVTITAKVFDIGDMVVDSGVLLTDMRIIGNDGRYYHSSSGLTGDTSLDIQAGMVVWITIRNNNVLGAGIEIIRDMGDGKTQSQGLILLPLASHTFCFSAFGAEPMSWHFDIVAKSEAFNVDYMIESTWVYGMPSNY